MNPLSLSFVSVCVVALLAALLGWFAPPTSGTFRIREASMFLAGVVFACGLRLDFSTGMSFVVLFPGIYLAFSGWQDERTPPKSACSAAFFGAAFLLTSTSRRVDYVLIAVLLGFGGYYLALWVSRSVSRRIALALVFAATVFQLTRISLLLAS